MLVLGIETATPVCGVCLANDGALVAEYRAAIKNAHGRLLAGAIQMVLRDAGVAVHEIQGIAVSIGPGSFTGLRIGLAAAKGLALATAAPITAVDTLAALATQAPLQDGLIAPLIRSRGDEYYLALYRRQMGVDRIVAETEVVHWETISAHLPQDALIIGATIQHPLPPGFKAAPQAFAHLSAYGVAHLGWRQLLSGQVENGDTLEPRYWQDFEAGKPGKSILPVQPHAL